MVALRPREKPEPPARAPAPVPTPTPTPSAVLTPQEPPPLLPCCLPNGRCLVRGQACTPAPCKDEPLADRTFWLRPTGMALRGKDRQLSRNLLEDHPAAEICMQLAAGGEEMCAPASKLGARDAGTRLPVVTSDLLNGQVKVRVVDRGKVIVNGRSAPIRDGLLTSVLCKGLVLYVGPRDNAMARLGAELEVR